MKLIPIVIIVVVLFIFPACQPVEDADMMIDQEPIQASVGSEHTEMVATQTAEPTLRPTLEPTKTPEVIPTEKPLETAAPVETAASKTVQTPKPTVKPTAKPTEAPTSVPTAQPTPQPIPEPTVEPTPTPTPEPEVEITSVSSSYINAAMAEINRLREANGVPPATCSGSISSSCQSHAVKMAESVSVFHASGIYMFEAVGRASKHMSGGTMGGSAANHVVQLQSEEVTKIGIGAVKYGDYIFYVVRGD